MVSCIKELRQVGGQLYQGVETGRWSCFAAGGLDICFFKTCCYCYEFHLIIYKKGNLNMVIC